MHTWLGVMFEDDEHIARQDLEITKFILKIILWLMPLIQLVCSILSMLFSTKIRWANKLKKDIEDGHYTNNWYEIRMRMYQGPHQACHS